MEEENHRDPATFKWDLLVPWRLTRPINYWLFLSICPCMTSPPKKNSPCWKAQQARQTCRSKVHERPRGRGRIGRFRPAVEGPGGSCKVILRNLWEPENQDPSPQ